MKWRARQCAYQAPEAPCDEIRTNTQRLWESSYLQLRCRVENGRLMKNTIPVAVSARHVHLRQASIDRLFGPGHVLQPKHPLAQPGQFAAMETVTLRGPHGRLDDVRVLGPPRDCDQVELSRSDEIALGIDAPLRISGDIQDTPGVALIGPAGHVLLERGVITAVRHIHMSPEDAQRMGVQDRQRVRVAVDSDGRDVEFGDVMVRVSAQYRLELHLDTDEGNAAGVRAGTMARLLR